MKLGEPTLNLLRSEGCRRYVRSKLVEEFGWDMEKSFDYVEGVFGGKEASNPSDMQLFMSLPWRWKNLRDARIGRGMEP